MIDDIWDLIGGQVEIYMGWRFWLAFVPTILLALLFQFVVGWGSATTTIIVVMALISSVVGIGWQLAGDGRFRR